MPARAQVMCKAGQHLSDDSRGLVFGLSLAATSLALLLLAAIVGLLMLRRSRQAELQQMRSLPQQRWQFTDNQIVFIKIIDNNIHNHSPTSSKITMLTNHLWKEASLLLQSTSPSIRLDYFNCFKWKHQCTFSNRQIYPSIKIFNKSLYMIFTMEIEELILCFCQIFTELSPLPILETKFL